MLLPLDLISYHPSLHKAMVRAFGGLLLAADSCTASQLAQQHGLAAVTPDGTLSRPGSVRGGYMGHGGAGGAAEAVFSNKLELLELEVGGGEVNPSTRLLVAPKWAM